MKKVLIISYSFPPFNNIAARRYGSMTKYMNEYGWKPYILTTNSEGTLPVEIDEQLILRVGTYPQNKNVNSKLLMKNDLPAVLYLIRCLTSTINFRLRTIDRSVINWYKDVKDNIEYIAEYATESDIILASYGPPAALWIGRYLSKKYNKPWIADIRDLGALRGDDRNKFSIWLDKKIEKFLFSTTNGFITVSNTLETILANEYKKDTKTIYNGWDIKTDETDFVEPFPNSSIINYSYIYYAGVFYNHRIRSFELLIESLSNFNDENLILVLRSLGPKEIEEKIVEMAIRYNVEDRIVILQPCPPNIVEQEQNNAIINLVIEDLDTSETWSRGTLTGKFLELIIRKPPVLAIARYDSEIGEILKNTSKGKLCSNVEEINCFLREIIFKKGKYTGNESEINKYSKKNQARELSGFLDQMTISEMK